MAARESLEDFSGLTELGDLDAPFELPVTRAAGSSDPGTLARDDDHLGRESLVPKGTFASEVPAADASAELRTRTGGELEAKPRPDAEPKPKLDAPAEPSLRQDSSGTVRTPPAQQIRPPAVDSSQELSTREPARPPFLASEILREDLYPRTPGENLQRGWLRAACVYGFLAAAFGCTLSPVAAGSFLGVIALACVDRWASDYLKRAHWLAAVGGGCTVAIASLRLALGGSGLDALLALVVLILPSALLLRAWHRASRTARAGLALGLVLAASWASATSSPSLLALGFEWSSWLPAVCWYAFAVICLLSLLAFMGEETTGGSDVWAGAMLAWFGVFACTRSALNVLAGPGATLEHALAIAEPTFTAACALGCAQVAAHRLGRRRQTTPSTRPAPLVEAPRPAESH